MYISFKHNVTETTQFNHLNLKKLEIFNFEQQLCNFLKLVVISQNRRIFQNKILIYFV